MNERLLLRAGPLSMVYENGDLRYIRLGEREVLRRVYAAARDRHWGTAPNVLSDVHVDVREDSFDIRYKCTNSLNDVHFVWDGRIAGQSDGTIEFVFDGMAQADFLRCRLGFCVLHPMRIAGRKARIEKVDGTTVDAAFPRRIAPQAVVEGIIKPVAPFDEMCAVSHEVAPGTTVRVAFEGDIFEMEDQRNWTDGSFKTYCTPLRLPLPVQVKQGDRITQKIRISLAGTAHAKPSAKAPKPVKFTLRSKPCALPKIGMSLAPGAKPLSSAQASRLRTLKLAHVRVDLPLWQRDWKRRLVNATKDAHAIGAQLEVALFVSDAAEAELTAYAAHIGKSKPPIVRTLVFHRDESATGLRWVELARARLGKRAAIYAGTNKFFTELNCNQPSAAMLRQIDGVCYGFNPQVHAVDDASLMETPEAQAETVHTAQAFAKGKPIAITPILLRPRHSLRDAGPEPDATAFDSRQMSLLGAAWTVASLKYVAEAGAGSVTYFELAGQRGVLDGARVFPMYHVFRSMAEFGGTLISTKSSDTLRVDGLALRKGKQTRLLLANMSAEAQPVQVAQRTMRATIKVLDARTAEAASRKPEAFWTPPGEPLATNTIVIPPYAVAQIDLNYGREDT